MQQASFALLSACRTDDGMFRGDDVEHQCVGAHIALGYAAGMAQRRARLVGSRFFGDNQYRYSVYVHLAGAMPHACLDGCDDVSRRTAWSGTVRHISAR